MRALTKKQTVALCRLCREGMLFEVQDWIAAKAKGLDTGADSELGRWAAWATAQADRIDPLVRRGPAPDAKPRPKSFYEIMSSIGSGRAQGQ